MPYYSWKGITLRASSCNGMQFARNPQELENYLFKKDIALLACQSKKIWLARRISLQNKIDYFTQVTFLIRSGMFLPEALNLVAQQSPQSFAQITHGIADEVQEGIVWSSTLSARKKFFDALMIQMTSVGQESGRLAESLQILVMHLESVASFRSRLRSALLLPIVTFCFFLMIIALLLIVVVPQFSSLFTSLGKGIPTSTQLLINASNFIGSISMGLIFLAAVGFFYCFRLYAQTEQGSARLDAILLRIPGIKTIVIARTLSGFFKSLSVLLAGGLPLIQALKIAGQSIDNQLMKAVAQSIEQEVGAGDSLAQSLARYDHFCNPEIVSLIKVGQESGMLAPMMERIAGSYQEKLVRSLTRVTTLFQPFLLIILGLLITSLILALYMPIMSLSYAF